MAIAFKGNVSTIPFREEQWPIERVLRRVAEEVGYVATHKNGGYYEMTIDERLSYAAIVDDTIAEIFPLVFRKAPLVPVKTISGKEEITEQLQNIRNKKTKEIDEAEAEE